MIIAISGKIGSGKDTIGNIIRYLTLELDKTDISFKEFIRRLPNLPNYKSNKFEIKKFSDKLKDTVCFWTGCTREQLEDADFKNSEIGEEWKRWYFKVNNKKASKFFNTKEEAIKSIKYDEIIKVNNYYEDELTSDILTYRLLLQLLGTDYGRNIIHPNIWINSLFADYSTGIDDGKTLTITDKDYPCWIITDTRFPNELQAVKDRGGISIRINRFIYPGIIDTPDGRYTKIGDEKDIYIFGDEEFNFEEIKTKYNYKNANFYSKEHESETALDNAEFDYVINNEGTIEELIMKVKDILIIEEII